MSFYLAVYFFLSLREIIYCLLYKVKDAYVLSEINIYDSKKLDIHCYYLHSQRTSHILTLTHRQNSVLYERLLATRLEKNISPDK